MHFLAPLWGLGFLALGAILAFYLLKRRYKDFPVPSTFLWRKARQDSSASHPFQRLRKNALLPLHLLLAAALVLGLMRPALGGGQGGEAVLIFDLSASMQAREGEKTRLEQAVEQARGVISGLNKEDAVTILTAGTAVGQPLSRSLDREAAYRALSGLRAEDGGADIAAALSLAQAMEKELGPLDIRVFSDDYAPPEGVGAMNAQTPLANAAALSFTVENGAGYARVANFGPAQAVRVACYAAGELCDARTLSLSEGETAGVSLSVPDCAYAWIQIFPEGADALAADNRAYWIPRLQKQYTVALLGVESVFLERALALREDIQVVRAAAGDETVQADLYVYGDSPLIFSLDRDTEIYAEPEQTPEGPLELTDLRFPGVTLEGVTLRAYRPLSQLDAFTLMIVKGRPVMIETDRAVALGFRLSDTNLPLKYDFPLLVQGVLSILLPTAAADVGGGECGQQVVVRLPGDMESAAIRLPDGRRVAASSPEAWGESAPFADTCQAGLYALEITGGASAGTRYFSLRVPENESDTRRLSPGVSGRAGGAAQTAGADLTPYCLLLALALLLLEWEVSRRVD